MKEIERVRGEIANLLQHEIENDLLGVGTVDQILTIKGIAILADEQSLPKNPHLKPRYDIRFGKSADLMAGEFQGFDEGLAAVEEAGFRKIVGGKE